MLSNEEVLEELDYLVNQRDISDPRVKQSMLILMGSIHMEEWLGELNSEMLEFAKRKVNERKE